MIPSIRNQFNKQFSQEKYERFLKDVNQSYHHNIPFRVAESPLFVDSAFKKKLITASDEIIDFLISKDFKTQTKRAIPAHLNVPNETDHTLFLALDFAVVKDPTGTLQPKLIEMQGFPSLFGWQDFLGAKFREHYAIPENLNHHFDLNREQFQIKLKHALLAGHQPENVILLEIDPLTQPTAIDFLITQELTGIAPVHIGDVIREDRKLFYKKGDQKIQIERIYNRVIFDELLRLNDSKFQFNLTEDVDVEWAGHPNWFLRISKYTMPFIKSEFIPECKFLSDYSSFPTDLENYVLKPLFSFSGSGVIFHLAKKDLDNIPADQRHNYLLQRKVQYEPVILTPDGMVKAEIRILFLWEPNEPRPVPVTNLARLSRGEMIGVKYNKDKTWVGGQFVSLRIKRMSSHHFVKEDQEPALLIINPDAISFEKIQEILEWSPLVMVSHPALERVLSWGIKVDVVLTHDDSPLAEIAKEQAPLKIIKMTGDEDEFASAGTFLAHRKQSHLNVIVDESQSLFPIASRLSDQINVVLFDRTSKWHFVSSGSYARWLPSQTKLKTFLHNHVEEIVTDVSGIFKIENADAFWVGEEY